MVKHDGYYKAQFWCWKCEKMLTWKELQNNHKHNEFTWKK